MLEADDRDSGLIERPAIEVGAALLADENPRLQPDQRFSHYRVLQLIGQGGMGEVYLAIDENLNRRVALKLLLADYTHDRDRLLRFKQEAQAASALNHPNILTIYEIAESDGLQFIATEFIEGETLRDRMKRGGLVIADDNTVTRTP